MMDTCWPEKLSLNKERVVKELVQGLEFATQLQIFLTTKPYRDDTSLTSSHHQLILKILASFTQALSLITTCESVDVSQNLATSQVDSVGCDDRRSEDSGESRKRPTTPTKDKRGCYKRKKTSQSWTRVSDIIEDGHAWRKYGQKEILNAKYPRSYFRCTHKFDQGCKATKQVQKMEEDPDMYQTTYIGQHTCRDTILLKFPQIITPHSDNNTNVNPHFLTTSNSSKIDPTAHHHPIIIKQEHKVDTPSDLTDSLDSTMWKDFMPFVESCVEPPTFPCDFGAVANSSEACSTSQSLDMDFVVKSIDFDSEDFHFDESEYLSKL